jgi:hypothetical protein
MVVLAPIAADIYALTVISNLIDVNNSNKKFSHCYYDITIHSFHSFANASNSPFQYIFR